MTPQSNTPDARRPPVPPAPTIDSLPPAKQFDEALGRLRDIAEWLGNLGIAARAASEWDRSGALANLSAAVDDAANLFDGAEQIIREAATCPA